MNNHEFIREHIKIEPEADSINVFVCKIIWSGPYTPVSKWELAAKLNTDISSAELDAQIHKLLNAKKYFQVCKDCGELNPNGTIVRIHKKSICHSCAEKNYEVYF